MKTENLTINQINKKITKAHNQSIISGRLIYVALILGIMASLTIIIGLPFGLKTLAVTAGITSVVSASAMAGFYKLSNILKNKECKLKEQKKSVLMMSDQLQDFIIVGNEKTNTSSKNQNLVLGTYNRSKVVKAYVKHVNEQNKKYNDEQTDIQSANID